MLKTDGLGRKSVFRNLSHTGCNIGKLRIDLARIRGATRGRFTSPGGADSMKEDRESVVEVIMRLHALGC